MKIIQASPSHLTDLVPLFDAYRAFYKQAPDREAAQTFLQERFERGDSHIFIAFNEAGEPMGFTQLYPSFSSVAMKRVYILNDLFVAPDHRNSGIGAALIRYAANFSGSQNARGMTLETAVDNPAQQLYERLGWKRDTEVIHYTWEA